MTEYYVSNSGNDDNLGSIEKPFLTIKEALTHLQPGDTLNLREGVYVEPIKISGKHGTKDKPILIRSCPGEHACIDGSLGGFRLLNNHQWDLASKKYKSAHPAEYISTQSFPKDILNSGAFIDYSPYTRLITYSNLNDLRAKNETFELITAPDKQRPGLKLAGGCPAEDEDEENQSLPEGTSDKPKKCYYPFVYMGPGLWFNRKTHRVHIRLSHTHNKINSLPDYKGVTNPNKVSLAISPQAMITLRILKSSQVHFENLSIRFGGDDTIFLKNVDGLIFDHVQIWAARHGVRMGGEGATRTRNTIFRHCDFNGGLPTWFFRSDRKAQYSFIENHQVRQNSLGKNTLDVLLLGSANDTGTLIHNCEFHDAHDLYLTGNDVCFHHNWIHNLNDEGLFLDAGKPAQTQDFQMKIYQNVITKTLSALSFAGNHIKGNWYIYRNLIDLRSPTAGRRPRRKNDSDVWRYGHLIKTVGTDGPRDLFQNTCLAYSQRAHAVYRNYQNLAGNYQRRTFNNIFVAIHMDSEPDVALAFLPIPDFPAPTDGNNYFRIGVSTKPLFRHNPSPLNPQGSFKTLDALKQSEFFQQSKNHYPPGYEARSKADNPFFRRIGTDGVFRDTDDLRLSNMSTLKNAGVTIPYQELVDMDPFAPVSGNPDIGCYPFGSGPFQVGVDSRRSYPAI